MHRVIFTCLLTFALSALAGNHGMPGDWQLATGKLDLKRYRLVWSDEFDHLKTIGKDGDDTPWHVGVHAILHQGERYAPAGDTTAYAVVNGVLTMTSRADAKGRYLEADLETADKHGHILAWQNFYAEIRLRGPQVNGIHSGIWFLGREEGQGHPELDLVEQYGPGDKFDHHASHIWAPPAPHLYSSKLISRPEGRKIDWHVYGLMATDDAFTVYRDGEAIVTIARQPSQRVPMYILLSLFGNVPKPPTATMEVDYVRVYEIEGVAAARGTSPP